MREERANCPRVAVVLSVGAIVCGWQSPGWQLPGRQLAGRRVLQRDASWGFVGFLSSGPVAPKKSMAAKIGIHGFFFFGECGGWASGFGEFGEFCELGEFGERTFGFGKFGEFGFFDFPRGLLFAAILRLNPLVWRSYMDPKIKTWRGENRNPRVFRFFSEFGGFGGLGVFGELGFFGFPRGLLFAVFLYLNPSIWRSEWARK